MTRTEKIAELVSFLDKKIVVVANGGSRFRVASALTFRAADAYKAAPYPAMFDVFCATVIAENKIREEQGLPLLQAPPTARR